ncbi:AAA domain-containing protein [Escherichia coli]|nr:AAA domain-containing protein [Escherichia coli]
MDLVDSVEAGKLTIRELIDALVKDKNYTASKWEQRYREFTTLLQQTSTFAEPETDDLVKRLWYERDNGIASIRQGVPSLAEYQQSLPLLRELTERVRQQPNEATYQYVGSALQQAKEIGQLKRMYWSLRNRVFAAFSPENYTSTVDENAFNKAAEFLNQRFHLGLVLTGNWLQKNYELKQAIHAQSPDTDPYYVNMAIWHIYELLRERDNEQKQEKVVDSQLEQVEDLLALHAELKRGPKSAEAIQRFAVVTFHQSYGYEEFIEGMRARSDESGNISYPIEPGIFMRLCQRANADPAHRYAIFIDEINRGNISKIFGELISLIEVDKRAGMPDAMSLQLSYSGEHFSVPANVDIIGAMNTADRSLALLDTALRRRFDFVEMMPDLSLLSGAKVKGIELESLLEKLNSRIEALYDREHTLGHAFFMPVKNALDTGDEETAFKQLKIAFQKKIIPLLQEYFFDDWNKIRLVLADNQKQDDNQQFVIEKTDDLDTLFGNNHGLRRHNQQSTTYELKDFDQGVWNMPKAYRSIYQPQRTTPDEQVVNHE